MEFVVIFLTKAGCPLTVQLAVSQVQSFSRYKLIWGWHSASLQGSRSVTNHCHTLGYRITYGLLIVYNWSTFNLLGEISCLSVLLWIVKTGGCVLLPNRQWDVTVRCNSTLYNITYHVTAELHTRTVYYVTDYVFTSFFFSFSFFLFSFLLPFTTVFACYYVYWQIYSSAGW